MLQQRSILFILDNSGAKKARCIQVHKKPKRGVAFIADKMTASVQQLTSNNVKLKKRSTMSSIGPDYKESRKSL